MYDNRYDWKISESEHFIYKYFPGSECDREIKDIISKREAAYKIISTFLGVDADIKFTYYFIPDASVAHSLKMMCGASVPHQYFASVIYNGFPFCRERISYGHEITHLLLYFWDREIFHLEFLEEGLAVYLDQSGTNKHLDFYSKLQFSQGINNIDLSLDVLPIAKCTDYAKAGSFVKFLIESYGLDKFKDLYISSKIERENNIFEVNSNELPKNYLKTLLKKKYNKSPYTIQAEWLKNLGIIL